MNPKFSDTEIVFKDLSDAFDELKNERETPIKVRRNFKNFILLSQQLTEIMRPEYKKLTSEKWEAKNFKGWNEITNLFKKLRNSDTHNYPVLIDVNETQHYFSHGQSLGVNFTWDPSDPLSKNVPDGVVALEADPKTGRAIYKKVTKPCTRSFKFVIAPRTKDIDNALQRAGTNDVHELSEKCFKTLQSYYVYYNECVENKRKM
jgi:hypothetical protein